MLLKIRTAFKRTIEAEISKKVKNNEAQPKFTGSYKIKAGKINALNSDNACLGLFFTRH